MRTFSILVSFFLCLHMSTSNANVQNESEYRLSNSYTHQYKSKLLNQDLSVHVALPFKYNPSKKYPVIYITDADILFGMVSQYAQLNNMDSEENAAIVVGVGYGSLKNWQKNRNQHYYPSKSSDKTSGAAQYLDFMSEELIPYIEKQYGVDSKRRVLYGHSTGGLFSLYTYVKKPELFKAIIASSPDIGWEDAWFTKNTNNSQSKMLTNLYVSFGELEKTSISQTEEFFNSGKFKFETNKLSYRIFGTYNRMGVLPVALGAAVQWSLALK